MIINISTEYKTIFLIGYFNIDLLKHDSHTSTNEFLYSFSCNMILPYILHPTMVTGHSNTLIDNIFSMVYKLRVLGHFLPLEWVLLHFAPGVFCF